MVPGGRGAGVCLSVGCGGAPFVRLQGCVPAVGAGVCPSVGCGGVPSVCLLGCVPAVGAGVCPSVECGGVPSVFLQGCVPAGDGLLPPGAARPAGSHPRPHLLPPPLRRSPSAWVSCAVPDGRLQPPPPTAAPVPRRSWWSSSQRRGGESNDRRNLSGSRRTGLVGR